MRERKSKMRLLDLKGQGATGIILDLRDNPGGLLNEAVNVSNVFIPKESEVVSTRGKVSDWNKTYRALNSPVDTEIPIAILTNSRSASAAEIVAGVIQDYDRGILVGQKTFGKGLVQATRPLTYNSQLKVTTAKYYIPSGRCIQAIDYSHRNEDGSVGKVPDSLKVAFQTANNRTVYDGGGVDPDIESATRSFATITKNLVSQSFIFDYATDYHFRHSEIKPAGEFGLSDEEYDHFVQWLSDKDFEYTTLIEKTIADLVTEAKEEKYFPEIETEIEDLKQKVDQNKLSDMVHFKDEIKEILEEDIASRYYFQQGIIEASFDNDVEVQKAIDVLQDVNNYNQLLSGN